MITLIALGFVTTLLMAYYSYRSSLPNFVKLLSLPLIIVYFGVAGYLYNDALGAPIKKGLALEFRYLHHTIKGDCLLIWAYTDERGNRLYKLPYNRETAKALEEAKKKQQEGAEITLKGDKEPKENGYRVQWRVEETRPATTDGETK